MTMTTLFRIAQRGSRGDGFAPIAPAVAPAPRQSIERPAGRPPLRMTWRPVTDEHGKRVLRASWHAGR
ncbi:hypothetical protein [Amycolatopsis sp. NPDC059021]|uniref:hypothetical protein n=1 Tax=Amycolatopsis sp. NPDC059021 TaxID=3346704 RepID=UPI00366DC993